MSKERSPASREKLPVSLKVITQSEKALLCTEGLKDGEGKLVSFWLPKSQIEYDEEMLEKGKVLEVSVPRWLCEEKGITIAR